MGDSAHSRKQSRLKKATPMPDSFTAEDAKSFTFEKLREDELALDRKASLIDNRTDIDNQQTVNLVWRILLLLR